MIFCLVEELPIGIVDEDENAWLDVFVGLDESVDVVDKLKDELKLESTRSLTFFLLTWAKISDTFGSLLSLLSVRNFSPRLCAVSAPPQNSSVTSISI